MRQQGAFSDINALLYQIMPLIGNKSGQITENEWETYVTKDPG